MLRGARVVVLAGVHAARARQEVRDWLDVGRAACVHLRVLQLLQLRHLLCHLLLLLLLLLRLRRGECGDGSCRRPRVEPPVL